MPKENKMYEQRAGNVPAFRGCRFSCIYCAFKRLVQMNKECQKCATFEPHSHMDALSRKPPKTESNQFVTIGLSGDISFATDEEMEAIRHYCWLWAKHTFLIQSKDPSCFEGYNWPENVVLGTTIETNYFTFPENESIHGSYRSISGAPAPKDRKEFLREHAKDNEVAVTIEPILDFDPDTLEYWMIELQPKWVWIGYDSGNHRLPEPELEKTMDLIDRLKQNGLTVFTKQLRKAWWEA